MLSSYVGHERGGRFMLSSYVGHERGGLIVSLSTFCVHCLFLKQTNEQNSKNKKIPQHTRSKF